MWEMWNPWYFSIHTSIHPQFPWFTAEGLVWELAKSRVRDRTTLRKHKAQLKSFKFCQRVLMIIWHLCNDWVWIVVDIFDIWFLTTVNGKMVKVCHSWSNILERGQRHIMAWQFPTVLIFWYLLQHRNLAVHLDKTASLSISIWSSINTEIVDFLEHQQSVAWPTILIDLVFLPGIYWDQNLPRELRSRRHCWQSETVPWWKTIFLLPTGKSFEAESVILAVVGLGAGSEKGACSSTINAVQTELVMSSP